MSESRTPRTDAATFTINWDDDIRRHGRFVPHNDCARIELDLAAAQARIAELEAERERLLSVVEAAKWANWCPDAGGYRDGRSVEDCYEQMHAALCEYYGVRSGSLVAEVPNTVRMSERELDAALAAKEKS